MHPAIQTLCLYLIVLRSVGKQAFVEDSKLVTMILFHKLDNIFCSIISNTGNQLKVNNEVKGTIGKRIKIPIIVFKIC